MLHAAGGSAPLAAHLKRRNSGNSKRILPASIMASASINPYIA